MWVVTALDPDISGIPLPYCMINRPLTPRLIMQPEAKNVPA